LPDFVRSFGQPLKAVSLRRPTLDDVFLHLTGHAAEVQVGDDEADREAQREGEPVPVGRTP
jgi:ABC-2 type transport system ATP-binding protein